MSSYNYTVTGEDIEHGDRYGAEETSEEQRWCKTCDAWESESYTCERAEAARIAEEEAVIAGTIARTREAEAMKTRRVKRICSCGSYTCGAIVWFGLTPPTFQGEIWPIPSQMIRDIKARDIKAGGGL